MVRKFHPMREFHPARVAEKLGVSRATAET
jgi:hypothetical protein